MSAKQIVKNSSHHAPHVLSSLSRSQTKSIYFSIALFEFCLIWIFIMLSIIDFRYIIPTSNSIDTKNHQHYHSNIIAASGDISRDKEIIKSRYLLEQCLNSSKTCSQKLATCVQSDPLNLINVHQHQHAESIMEASINSTQLP